MTASKDVTAWLGVQLIPIFLCIWQFQKSYPSAFSLKPIGDRHVGVAHGLQFHPEMTREMMDRWTTLGAEQLTLPGAQSPEEQMQQHSRYAIAMDNWLRGFLCLWQGVAKSNKRKNGEQ